MLDVIWQSSIKTELFNSKKYDNIHIINNILTVNTKPKLKHISSPKIDIIWHCMSDITQGKVPCIEYNLIRKNMC